MPRRRTTATCSPSSRRRPRPSGSSYFHEADIPGKAIKQLLNPTGRWKLQVPIRESVGKGLPASGFPTGQGSTEQEATDQEPKAPASKA
ncbi:hypothetical protein [Streptomyces griseoruber]|uniref:hypothetical protein n=1 Tax=Streptomyces griseoruber TaxID=1943 RepID=UPI00099E5D90